MKKTQKQTPGELLQSSIPGPMVKRSLSLEPRVLLDAAAVDTAVKMASDSIDVGLSQVAPSAGTGHEVVFIDGAVANIGQILQGIDLQRYEVHVLDSNSDGLAQIAGILSASQGVTSVHIVSHGADGKVQLGNVILSSANLLTEQQQLARIGQALGNGADILLYGCDIAADSGGRGFVDALSTLTGHDVAASVDITGLSGNWALEYHHGLVESDALHPATYNADLNLDGVQAGATVTGGTGQEMGSYVDADGAWVVAGGGTTAVPSVTVWLVNGASRTSQTISRPDTTNWSTTFGQGVAIDSDTGTLVIADPNAGTYGKLAVYRVQYNADGSFTWALAQTIVVDNSSSSGRIGAWTAGYGKDYLAISGGHIVVGAPAEGSNSGRIFWYADTSAAGNWSSFSSGYVDEPEALNAQSSTRFGASVALAGDYLVVSSASADTNGDDSSTYSSGTGNYGRVYVFNWASSSIAAPSRYTNGSWSYLAGQDDMNGLNGGNGLSDQYFGADLAMEYYNGKYTIVAGAPGDGGNTGKVYIYQSTNSDIGTLQAAVGIYGQATSGDLAGSSVDVSQGRILVGAYAHTATTESAAWYYEAPSNDWTVLGGDTNNPTSKGILQYIFTDQKLGHSSGTDRLGYSLALSQGNTVVLGSPYYSTGAAGQPGGVDFIYMRTPVAANDTASMGEDANTTTYLSIDILGNDVKGTEAVGTSVGASTFTVSNIAVAGFGDAYWDSTSKTLKYRQGTDASGASNYNYLAAGETAYVVISYKLTGDDFTSSATVTITINGINDNPSYVSGSIPNLSGNRTIDTNGSAAGGVANGGTVGYFAGDPSTPYYQIQAGSFSDPDISNTFTYALDTALTSGAIASSGSSISISPTGKITWSLTSSLAAGTYTVGIKCTDNSGGTASGTIQFTVLRDDIRPETQTANLPSGNTIYWTQNASSTQSVLTWFKDVDTSNAYSADEAITYSVSYSGPGSSSGWLSIRSDTGLLQGTPTNSNVGNTAVIVTATDKYGQSVSYNFTLTVRDINDAPILNGSVSPQQAGQGVGFSYQIPGWNTTGAGNTGDDLFVDADNPGSLMTYTAVLVDANGNVLRTLGASPSGSGAGSWLTFSGGTYNPSTYATAGTATFGGTSNDDIGTKLYVRVTATDSGTSWNGSSYVSDPKSTSYTFTIQTFAPTISVSPTGSGATASELGTAVAISRDGTYMVVGAPNDSQKGTVVSYFWGGTSWTTMSTAFTVPAAAVAGDRFGQSVALDYNGDRLLVGATGTATGAGTVYAFTRTGTGTTATWTLAATYTETGTGNPRNAGDGFGTSLAFYTDSNNTNDGQSFIVGAPFDSDAASAAGKAFLFGWGNTTPVATISPSADSGDGGTSYDEFGFSVAFSGNIAVIGAPGDTHDGYFMAGSVTVLAINNPTTTNPSVLNSAKATLGASSDYYDMYGYSVSLQLFDGTGNAANVLDSALLAVGTPGSNVLADDAGAVYLYRADNLVAQAATRATLLKSATPTAITAYDGMSFQYFGSSVAVTVANRVEGSGTNRLLVGSQQTGDSTGSVYMFKYTTSWNGQRFTPSGSGVTNGMFFGRSVAMAELPGSNNPNWVAGAPYAGTSYYDGRVYASNAAAATALSLDGSGGTSGALVPMSVADFTTTTSSGLVTMSAPTTSTSTSMLSSPSNTTTTLAPLSGTNSTDTTSSTIDTTTASPSSTFSDMLLMDMLTTDPLATDGSSTCVDASSCLAYDGFGSTKVGYGLTRQLQFMHEKRSRGVQALLDDLDALVS